MRGKGGIMAPKYKCIFTHKRKVDKSNKGYSR